MSVAWYSGTFVTISGVADEGKVLQTAFLLAS